MSTLTIRGQLTLVELAKRTNNKELLTIAEVLNEDNPILDDAVFVEANQVTSHKITRRTSLPTGSFRKINSGVAEESSSTVQIVEDIGMLEAYATIDKKLVDIAPNPAEFRSGEERAFIEGLSQTLVDTLIYGNRASDPEQFNGFAVRPDYDDKDHANVWTCSGSGSDVTSIWIIQWGVDKVHLIYPRGSQTMGINRRDLGEQTVYDDYGNPFQAYRTHFAFDCGLVIRNLRNVQRICNIETTGSSNIFDDDQLVKALNHMPQRGSGAVIYANETICSQMDIAAKDKSNVSYQPGEAFGQTVTMFQGHPVRKLDALLNTEDALS